MTENNIQEARQRVTQARTQLETQRAEAKKQKEILQEAKKTLPRNGSQRALRQTMDGIKGRVKRRQIAKAKEKLEKQESKVKEFEKGLTRFETEKIKPVEAEIKRVEKDRQDFEMAKKLYPKFSNYDTAKGLIEDEGVKKYLKQFYQQKELAQEFQERITKTGERLSQGLEVSDFELKRFEGALSRELTTSETLLKNISKTADLTFKTKLESKIQDLKSLREGIKIDAVSPTVLEVAPQQVLKITEPLKIDDIDVPIRDDRRFFGKILGAVTGAAVSIIGDKEDRQKGREVFEPTKGIVSAFEPEVFEKPQFELDKPFGQRFLEAPSTLLGGVRKVSERQAALVGAESILGLGRVTEVAGVGVTRLPVDVGEQLREVKRLEGNIKQLDRSIEERDLKIKQLEEGKINEFGQFIGTEAELNRLQRETDARNKIVNRRNELLQEQERRSRIRVGFVGGGMERDVREFDISGRPISGTAKLVTATIGATVGKRAEQVLDIFGFGEKVIEEKKVTVIEPQFGSIQRNILTGEIITGEKEIVVPERVITPVSIGKKVAAVTEFGLYIGKFAIPVVGTGLFAAEAGEVGVGIGRTLEEGKKLTKAQKIEIALLGGALLTVGAIKGAGIIKNKAIQRAVANELRVIEQQPIKSLTIIDEGAGVVRAKGIVEVGQTTKEIEYVGRIMETETGKKFVATGTGALTVTGEVTPTLLGFELAPRRFVTGTEFELGARGKDIFLGRLGKEFTPTGVPVLGTEGAVKVFEEVGTTTIIPKRDVFGITKLERGKLTKAEIADLEKQLMKVRPSKAEVIKDITLPIDQRNILFQVDSKLGLRVSPQEVGVVVKVPKPKEVTEIGFRGGGTKTPLGKTFAEQPKPVPKDVPTPVITPKISDITTQIKLQPGEIPTEISGLPIGGSAFEGTGLFERMEVTGISPVQLQAQVQPTLTFEEPRLEIRQKFLDVGIKQEFVQPRLEFAEPTLKKAFAEPRVKQIQTFQEIGLRQEFVQPGLRFQQPSLKKAFAEPTLKKAFAEPRVTTKPKITAKPKLRIKPTPATDLLGLIQREGEFKIKVRKGGKDIKIGEATTKQEAKEMLLKRLKKTLRASGHVERAGKRIDLGFLGEGFRRSKKEPKRVVEIRQKRIKRKEVSGEAQEIQFFRKQRGSRNGLF